ncbi:MAG: MucR family transcriptional regulator [Thermodesulfobacteriota bacterium]
MAKTLVEMAADIVQAQSSTRSMSTDEITFALQQTFKALQGMQQVGSAAAFAGLGEEAAEEAEAAAVPPAISPEKSIQKNRIICLECGQEFKMLSPKHLRSHNLDGRSYRKKHGFSLRQPLCAKSLSERRKKAGKERGLPENLRKSIQSRPRRGQGA